MNHRGFLADICEHPGDDAPRLIYADWLEDNGDPDRAEFIRIQVERAKLPLEDDRHAELEARERRLVLQHADNWVPAELPLRYIGMERGFPNTLAPDPGWLTEEQIDSIGPQPFRHLSLYGHDGELDTGRISVMPLLGQIESLRIGDGGNPISGGEIREVLEADQLTRLRSLDVSGNGMEPHSVARLLEMPIVQQVETLYLGNNAMNDATLRRLLNLPLPNLRRLGVGYNGLSAEGYLALMESELWAQLEEIDLGRLPATGISLSHCVGAIERMQAKSLCVSVLPGNSLLPALLQASTWGPLRTLIVGESAFSDGVLERWLECPHLTGLRELYFCRSDVNDHLARFAHCPHLANLERLELSDSVILDHLATSRYLCNLHHINGWGSEQGVIDFVRSENAAHVRWLYARRLTDRIVEAIANSPHLGRLTSLVGQAPLTDWGAEMLAMSPHLKNLTCVLVNLAELSSEGIQTLLEAEHLGWVSVPYDVLRKESLRKLWRERYGDGDRVWLIDNGLRAPL